MTRKPQHNYHIALPRWGAGRDSGLFLPLPHHEGDNIRHCARYAIQLVFHNLKVTALPAGVSGGGVPGAPMTRPGSLGVASCVQSRRGGRIRPQNTGDSYVTAGTKLSLENLEALRVFCGPTKRPHRWRLLPERTSVQRSDGCAASMSRRPLSLLPRFRRCCGLSIKPGCEAASNPGACHVKIAHPHENDVWVTTPSRSGASSPALIPAQL